MNKISENTSVFSLAWPIFIEMLLFMMMGNVDTFMLSRYSDSAVAAVGNANQMVNTINMLFTITTAATGIMITQYLGAKQEKKLNQVYSIATVFNVFIATVMTIGIFMFQSEFFKLINLPLELVTDTKSYLDVIMGFLVISAMYMTLSTIHKSHGNTKLTMYIALGINILNVIGNYIFLFGPLGLPVLGVKGVAISTVVSRSIGMLIMLSYLVLVMKQHIHLKNLIPFPKEMVKQFFKLGLPSAGEPISWQFSQMFIFAFINIMGTTTVTTRMYSMIIIWFTFLFAMAIAQATQIITGYLVGAGRYDDAYHLVFKSLRKAILASLTVSLLFVLFRYQLLGIFTDNKEIIELGAKILIIDLFLELGRVTNITVIFSMRAAGDVNFPVIVGILSMWGISTLGAYVLGIHLGWGLAGIWIAMTADEITRAIIMIFRWRSGKWRGRAIVHEAELELEG
ncbi:MULTISPECIES: MATE family efflux transporter [unclassified Fusibacter]|uniref:MATE family efflux transporter n=1 Tax=unclassified Fusibacter TaxID=2624464 RepID=UPI001010909D|nr:MULTISPECIES: MATE family efflux transporter [unclassified Fusibacter]MCK8060003.1 MATE family efflux transporter [Fusibacter sp. A2]NPE22143.1 MATE family efflux transporter [Fusibacter sp. A1]RXV60921.1 MATE family efflux transporter [Fusibacter sp. A1]